MTPILHSEMPYDPLRLRPLPGVQPLGDAPWLLADEVYAAQMAQRRALLATRRDEVLALDPGAGAAARELLELVLDQLQGVAGFERRGTRMRCPDGTEVEIGGDAPLAVLGALVQEDLCLLMRRGDEHVLVGAVLCFPASWTLAEKFLRPLVRIHAPVPGYAQDLGRRVQRMFDAVRPGQTLWRANALWYDSAELHSPRREGAPRVATSAAPPFLRSERQCILKLESSGAAVFSIHTYMMERARVEHLFGPAPAVESHSQAGG